MHHGLDMKIYFIKILWKNTKREEEEKKTLELHNCISFNRTNNKIENAKFRI